MSGEELQERVKEMLRVRLSQVLINEECKAGKFKVPVHLAMGHEAVAVAVNHALHEGDKLVLPHRNAAYNLARLGKLKPILDEYLLKPTGLAGGRLGSMNLMNPARGIVYTSSILGNNFPVSAGIAMAEKISASRNATFILGGDGSMEEGSFYESLMMMKTLGLSVVVIIENNEWSLGTRIAERRCPINLEKLAGSVGISYFCLAGNRIREYLEKLGRARDESVGRQSPICIEAEVKTLGDWRGDDGHFINYHSGPTPSVNVAEHAGGVLREDEDDPLFVAQVEIGREKITEMAREVMEDLRKEML